MPSNARRSSGFISRFPQGQVYFDLRTTMLETFVAGSKATLGYTPILSEWFTNGTYTVISATSKEIIIRAATVDYASSLLMDVECLTDHCFEHLQEMICFHSDKRVRSDAWAVVTTYYFAFFCAQAFLRISGTPVLFLTKEKIKDLKRIGSVTKVPGAGTFVMEKVQDISASHAEYRLKGVDAKIHEATWKKALQQIYDRVYRSNMTTNDDEVGFYTDLTVKSLYAAYNNNYDWPSGVRVKANYSPGYAYKRVQNGDITKSRKMMDGWKAANEWTDVLKLLSSSVADCSAGKKSAYHTHVHLLNNVAQCLFILTRQLYSELVLRRQIDKRWEMNRERFRKSMDISGEDYSYIAQTY